MAFQATLFFSDARFAWSEKYFCNSNVQNVGDAEKKAVLMAMARAKVMAVGPTLQSVTVSDTSITGDSLQAPLNLYQGNDIKTTSKVADRPYSSVKVRMEAGSLYRSIKLMSGFPDDYITDIPGGEYNVSDAKFTNNWNQFKLELIANWALFVISKDTTINPHKPIQNIVVAGDGLTTITCNAHGFSDRSRIGIHQAKPRGKVNGYHILRVVDANSFTLLTKLDPAYVYKYGGFVQGLTKALYSITDVADPFPVAKKRGGRSSLVRGRATTKR